MTPSLPQPDDDAWFELVAGRTAADVSSPTRQEAAWLRAALLAYRAQPPVGDATPPEVRIERLLRRARAAGLLPPVGTFRPGRSRWLDIFDPRRWRLAAAAAAVVMVALALPSWLGRHQVDELGRVERGGPVQTRGSADPAADRDALRRELKAIGIAAEPYQRLDRLGLDVELPLPLSVAQQARLEQLGLAPRAGAEIRIEFVAAGARP